MTSSSAGSLRRRWRHYRTETGATPAEDFLDKLDNRDGDAVRAAMRASRVDGVAGARHLRGDVYVVRAARASRAFMRGATICQVESDSELDDLEAEVAAAEEKEPGYRARLDQLTEVVRVTTSLWVRREEIGLSVEEVAIRSGLSLDEVEAIENNAVDTPFPNLARYAAAVGLRLDVTVTAA